MTEKLLTYALGRGLDYHDMPAVRAIVRERRGRTTGSRRIVLGIVTSVPFQMRVKWETTMDISERERPRMCRTLRI